MDVKFYHNAANRLLAACSITAKAVAQGRKIVVYVPDPALAQQFDALLWRAQPESFIPHVAADSPLASHTAVVLTPSLEDLPYDDVLLNLADELPAGYARFKLLVEIVSDDEAGRVTARNRWRFYKEQQHALEAYDLAKIRTNQPKSNTP